MGLIPVAVIDNGRFEAARILIDEDDFAYVVRRLADPRDQRPVQWLAVPYEDVVKWCPQCRDHLIAVPKDRGGERLIK